MGFGKTAILMLAVMIVIVGAIPFSADAIQDDAGIFIVTPENNSTISTHTPVIIAEFNSTVDIKVETVNMVVDKTDITYLGSRTVISENNITYTVKPDLALEDGHHNVTVKVTDSEGVEHTYTWGFTVGGSQSSANIQTITFYVVVITGLGLIAFGAALVVLKKTRNFSLRKHFKKHPVPKKVYYAVIPAVTSFFFVLLALSLFEGAPGASPFITEYVLVIGIFILLLPYSIYVQTEKKKKLEYERSFSQFLYEMADAMRGGIDPSKAVIELSKTDTTILSKHLKIAANGLEMGRPFEEVIEAMVKPIESKLIKRYASLIGESAKIGGEVSQVVHRAAKDMDDLIKIDLDRTRGLAIQGSTIYISFGVLLIVVYLLISIYPTLGSADLGNMFSKSSSGLDSGSSSTTATAKMSFITIKQRFLDLIMVTGLGSGLIIGVFTNGKMKYGLVHGLIMMLAGAVFLMIMMA
jgi:pilus assembly protein TadC